MHHYYDQDGDVLVWVLADGEPVDTQFLGDLAVVFDRHGKVLEVELARASSSAAPGATTLAPQVHLGLKTLAELGLLLGVQVGTLRKAAQRGSLKAVRLGYTWVASEADAQAWLGAPRKAGRPLKVATA